jgi:hypothetical protein
MLQSEGQAEIGKICANRRIGDAAFGFSLAMFYVCGAVNEDTSNNNEGSKPIAWTDVAAVYDTLTLTQGLFGAVYSLAEKISRVDDRHPIDAAVYAIEAKAERAVAQLEELIGRLKPSYLSTERRVNDLSAQGPPRQWRPGSARTSRISFSARRSFTRRSESGESNSRQQRNSAKLYCYLEGSLSGACSGRFESRLEVDQDRRQ